MYIVKWISTDSDEIKERVFACKDVNDVVSTAESIWNMLNNKEQRQHRIIAGEVDEKGDFIKIIKDF